MAAIFVLPCNSALNPFLYTLNGVLEARKRRRQKEKIARTLAKLRFEIHSWSHANVQDLISVCVQSKTFSKSSTICENINDMDKMEDLAEAKVLNDYADIKQ